MRIVRLKNGERVTVVLLAPLWGCYCHWNGERTEPCWRERKACDGCKRGYPVRWKGYLHCIHLNNQRECFLELTPQATKDLWDMLGGKAAPLRGQRLMIERGRGDKARLKVTVLAAMPNADHLPQPKDPEKILLDLWNRGDHEKDRLPPADLDAGQSVA